MTSLREAIDGIVPIRPREVRLADVQIVSSWKLVDPDGIDTKAAPPTVLRRADGLALFYDGMVNVIQGEPSSGKSWIALSACVEAIADGRHVLYLDFEADYRSVTARLIAMGLTAAEIAERFHYIRPEDRMDERASIYLLTVLESLKPSLVVIDGVTEALALEGYKENDPGDIATFRNRLSRVCAGTGAAVVEIDHVVKAKAARGLDARGSGGKRGGVQGAAYIATVTKPFRRGASGVGRLVVAKDRHGFVGVPGSVAAIVHFNAQLDGRLTITLTDPADSSQETDRLPALMERMSLEIEDHPGHNTRSLRDAVSGDNTHKTAALARLVDEGYVQYETAQKARLYYSVRPYREVAA